MKNLLVFFHLGYSLHPSPSLVGFFFFNSLFQFELKLAGESRCDSISRSMG